MRHRAPQLQPGIPCTGRPEREQLGSGWAEQLHPEDRERARTEWAQAALRGDRFDIELRIRRGDGVYRWFKTRAVPLTESAEVLAVGTVGRRGAAGAARAGLRESARVPVDENGLARCLRGQLVDEADTAQVPFPFAQRLASCGLHALVLAPLSVESRVFGILVATRSEPDAFASTDCEFLRQLEEQVGLAAHQAQLYGALIFKAVDAMPEGGTLSLRTALVHPSEREQEPPHSPAAPEVLLEVRDDGSAFVAAQARGTPFSLVRRQQRKHPDARLVRARPLSPGASAAVTWRLSCCYLAPQLLCFFSTLEVTNSTAYRSIVTPAGKAWPRYT